MREGFGAESGGEGSGGRESNTDEHSREESGSTLMEGDIREELQQRLESALQSVEEELNR